LDVSNKLMQLISIGNRSTDADDCGWQTIG
jgi:hypothetical protein